MDMETPVPEGHRRRRSGRRRAAVVLTAAAVAVSLTGAAWAAVPDADERLHGCYSADGALRVVDPSSSDRKLRECTSRETAITWNQEGPAGAPGTAGAPGRRGSGCAGPAGPRDRSALRARPVLRGRPVPRVRPVRPGG